MEYHISTVVKGKSFEETVETVKSKLANEGFGIPSEVNMQQTFKMKLDVDFRKYLILGACNPEYAYKAVQSEKNLGVLLPCNVILQENENNEIEVSAVDPIASMTAVNNDVVQEIAEEIKSRLERVIKSL